MTELLHWLFVVGFSLAGACCILLVVMQLPGTWAMLILATGVQAADTWWLQEDATAGWWALGIALLIALAGEVVEVLAGVAGAKTGGGSKRGMWGAFIGAVLGALVGTFVIPVPLIGSLLGAIGGAFIGAMVGETSGPSARSLKGAFKPAAGAAAGRALGTIAKTLLACLAWIVLVVGLALN